MRATTPNLPHYPPSRYGKPPYYQPSYPYSGYPYGSYGGGYGYPGYSVFGYGGYGGYGGYVGGGYGSYDGYPAYPPVIQQQPVIILRDADAPPAGAIRSVPPEKPDSTPKPDSASRPDAGRGGDFYLKGAGEGEGISDALDDIRKAWLNGDWERLKARFPATGQVGIYPGGVYKYSVDAPDFVRMLKQAMARIDTSGFEFDRPKSDTPGRAFVSGKHTFLDADRKKQETYISYTLERVDGKWRIVDAGSAASPIKSHEK